MIYLDNHSTTQLDKRVAEAMKPFFFERFGNPSSVHAMGEDAKQAIEEAREQVASIIKAKSDEIFFTNSATEANNLIIKSAFINNDIKSETIHILITNVEHSSIKKSIEWLEDFPSFNPLYIKVKKDGNINLNELEQMINIHQKELALVSIIGAQNEIGTIADLKVIGKICKKYEVLFHSDLTQLIGKEDINVDEYNLFSASFSSHKIYGPKGCGALFVRNVGMIENLIHGGNQEIVTSGTQNVPNIVGFGKACEILQQEGKEENERISRLRDLLWQLLSDGISDIFINGTIKEKNRLPNNLNVTIKDIKAEVFVKGMDNVIVSGGSACMSNDLEPSPVQIAIGNPYPECAIRFGLGRFNTKQDIIYAANRIIEIVKGVRGDDNAKEDRYEKQSS